MNPYFSFIPRKPTAILLVVVLMFDCGLYAKASGPKVNRTKPNVVVTFTDDLGCYGSNF